MKFVCALEAPSTALKKKPLCREYSAELIVLTVQIGKKSDCLKGRKNFGHSEGCGVTFCSVSQTRGKF